MIRKKILVLTPVSVEACDSSIAKTLAFLHSDYDIDYLDSLSIMADVDNAEYYRLWQERLSYRVSQYDVFIGFSFGGVILQQCFALFSASVQPIILFSTPSFTDASLAKRLGQVVSLCQRNQLDIALKQLYDDVFYPHPALPLSTKHLDTFLATKRMIFGLKRVLDTDSTALLTTNKVHHWHFIGAQSHLVNQDNVIKAANSQLITVPEAGMRVLQDNPVFCQAVIKRIVNCET